MWRSLPIQQRVNLGFEWARDHYRAAIFAFLFTVLVLATAEVSVGITRKAIVDDPPTAAPAAPATMSELPREWRWSVDPITFGHMYRASEPHAVADYTRDLSRTYYSSSSE